MKTKLFLSLLLPALLLRVPAPAQSPAGEVQRFAKGGLSFDYSGNWKLTDFSNEVAQNVVLVLPDTTAVIQVTVYRELLQSFEQVWAIQLNVLAPYEKKLATQLDSSLPQALKETGCISVSNRPALKLKLTGQFKKQPTHAYIYSAVLGQRFVQLNYIRADKDEAHETEGVKVILDSLNIEPPANQTSDAAKIDNIIMGDLLTIMPGNRPPPRYPTAARSNRVQGTVTVQVTVNESGNVIEANAISGNSLLREASEDAAKRAKFASPFCGRPMKVTGLITYAFVLT